MIDQRADSVEPGPRDRVLGRDEQARPRAFGGGADALELALAVPLMVPEFEALLGPLPPAGWTRTFLLFADGYSKEMDINSASPDEVAPLPFHGMTRYPYAAPERYPDTPAYRRYRAEFNTRVVWPSPPPLTRGHR